MKALVLDKPGSPETLKIAQMPKPEPGEDEVLIKVHAVGLNPADYQFAKRGFRTWKYPFILGLDVAGTVEALGANVTDWNIGDAVYYHGDLSKPGAYAEWAVVAAHTIALLPPTLSFTEAAALPCAGFTAYQVLHQKLHVQADQTILIHGGAGGVGGFAVQLAVLAGLQIISTCSSSNFEWVRKLGAKEVLDYNTEDIASSVRELTKGRGVDAIVDTVSSASATTGLELLAFGGGIACVAGLPDFTHMKSFGKAVSVHDVALGGAYLSGDVKAQRDLAAIGRKFGTLVSKHQVNPMLQEVISLEEVPLGLMKLQERHVRGKIVAQIQ